MRITRLLVSAQQYYCCSWLGDHCLGVAWRRSRLELELGGPDTGERGSITWKGGGKEGQKEG